MTRCACCGQTIPVDRMQKNGLPERRVAQIREPIDYRRRARDVRFSGDPSRMNLDQEHTP